MAYSKENRWYRRAKKAREKKHAKYQIITSQNQSKVISKIKWIEKGILEHPLPDHRKYIVWRILSPYLLNTKKLPKEESYSVIKGWLDRCNELERLNFNAKIKIKEGLRGATKGYFPISIDKLKEENKALYDIVTNRMGKSEWVYWSTRHLQNILIKINYSKGSKVF